MTAGARALGGEALRRVHLDDPRAHRLDDPPAAGVGPQRDRGRGGDRRPSRARGSWPRLNVAVGDQRERDDAHRLLRVVGAVREREQAAGGELAEPEAAVDRARAQAPDDPVGDEDRHAGHHEGEQRARSAPGTTTFSSRPVALDGAGAARRRTPRPRRRRSARATSSTAGRSTTSPGSRRSRRSGRRRRSWCGAAPASTMPLPTVAATLSEMNAPTKFRIAAIPTASARRQRARRDRRGHGVGGVVEAVGEVERQRRGRRR